MRSVARAAAGPVTGRQRRLGDGRDTAVGMPPGTGRPQHPAQGSAAEAARSAPPARHRLPLGKRPRPQPSLGRERRGGSCFAYLPPGKRRQSPSSARGPGASPGPDHCRGRGEFVLRAHSAAPARLRHGPSLHAARQWVGPARRFEPWREAPPDQDAAPRGECAPPARAGRWVGGRAVICGARLSTPAAPLAEREPSPGLDVAVQVEGPVPDLPHGWDRPASQTSPLGGLFGSCCCCGLLPRLGAARAGSAPSSAPGEQ